MAVRMLYIYLSKPQPHTHWRPKMATSAPVYNPASGRAFGDRRMWAAVTFDAAAELIMSGGWTDRRNPVCSECHMRKAVSGACGC